MRRAPLLPLACALILSAGQNIFAQAAGGASSGDKKIAVGLGMEYNMNSRDYFAGGLDFGFDYNLPVSFAKFALGAVFTASYNFDGICVLEPGGMFRWYFLGHDHTGWFAQGDVGAYIILGDENGEKNLLVMGGLRGGYRLPLEAGNISMYVEPYGRIGYPFAFGVGAIAGIRF